MADTLEWDKLLKIVGRLALPENYRFDLRAYVEVEPLSHVERIHAAPHPGRPERRFALRIACWRPDSVTGTPAWGYGGEYLLPVCATEQQIVFKAFAAYRDYQEHEAREAFRYVEVRLMGPHPNLRLLLRAQSGEFA